MVELLIVNLTMTDNENRLIALAGMCQACRLTKQIAREGTADPVAFEVAINSLLITNPKEPIDVFGGIKNLQIGLKEVVQQLGNAKAKDLEVARYALALIVLAKKLLKKPNVLQELSNRIEQMKRQVEHFSINDETVIKNFAAIYSELISPLGPKIQVMGSPEVIKQPIQQAKIRTAMLACVRSIVLWRQLGGSRLQIFFNRNNLVKQAQLLEQQI